MLLTAVNPLDDNKNVTVYLLVMGLESMNEQDPVRTTTLDLLDGTYVIQQRGNSAKKISFRGTIPIGGPRSLTGTWQWERLLFIKNQRCELSGEDLDRPLNGYISGTPTMEKPDLRDGIPIQRRWRFEFTVEYTEPVDPDLNRGGTALGARN